MAPNARGSRRGWWRDPRRGAGYSPPVTSAVLERPPQTAVVALDWRDPVEVMRPHGEREWAVLLLSDGGAHGRWSFMALEPDLTAAPAGGALGGLETIRGWLEPPNVERQTPAPFCGGVVGLATYEFGERIDPVGLDRDPAWPDLVLARYPAVLAFDHHNRRLLAIGTGPDPRQARRGADRAAAWIDGGAGPGQSPPGGALATIVGEETSAAAYEAAVADVVARIGRGEIFQANIARAWQGRLRAGATPFDVFARLTRQSPAPFCAFWRLPGRAIASHSPERFVSLDAGGSVESRPIKGTRPRGLTTGEDVRLAAELCASDKDRAENLMIVDLMRNDLARVCEPASVSVTGLCELESFASVHHLVSTVRGRLQPGADAAALLAAAFPPGSITGAPKLQAMKVIALHESPRGPWCGSLFRVGRDGALDSSVLIRTAGFVEEAQGWRFRTLAGAGITADSDPLAERLETEAKIAGLLSALGDGRGCEG